MIRINFMMILHFYAKKYFFESMFSKENLKLILNTQYGGLSLSFVFQWRLNLQEKFRRYLYCVPKISHENLLDTKRTIYGMTKIMLFHLLYQSDNMLQAMP